jgi:hypothetical protein
MNSVKEYRLAVERARGQRDILLEQLRESKKKIQSLKKEEESSQKARALIQIAAKTTQEQLQYHLSELAKLALAAVFDDPYEFEVAFEQRRGKTEVDFWFVRKGQRIDPAGNTGLGAVDIVGMALRASLWSLRRPRSRATLWCDEPFKHLKGEEANRRALEVIQRVAKPQKDKRWPGCQIIMVADERSPREEIEEVSDRLFEVKKSGVVSTVEEI